MNGTLAFYKNTNNQKIVEKLRSLRFCSITKVNPDYTCEILCIGGKKYNVVAELNRYLYTNLSFALGLTLSNLLHLIRNVNPELPLEFYEYVCGNAEPCSDNHAILFAFEHELENMENFKNHDTIVMSNNREKNYETITGPCCLESENKICNILPHHYNEDEYMDRLVEYIKKNCSAIGGISKVDRNDMMDYYTVYFFAHGFSLGPDYGRNYTNLVTHMIDEKSFNEFYNSQDPEEQREKAPLVEEMYHGLLFFDGISTDRIIKACSIIANVDYDEILNRMKKTSLPFEF